MRKKAALTILALCGIAIVWLRPGELLETGASAGAAPEPSGGGLLAFDLVDGATAEQIAAFEQRYGLKLEYSAAVAADEALLRARVDDVASVMARVRADPLVEVVEPVVELHAFGGYPDDPLYARQWNMPLVGALLGWRAGGGRGITVAVLDTGVTRVEDLEGLALAGGMSFVPGVSAAQDDNGHGTHVAGTIAQATHNGRGVAGIAPNVRLVPFKVLSASGAGDSDRIAAAIDEAADEGVDIINMSLGGPYSAVLAKAAAEAARRGVLVVAAAGNTGERGIGCPASVREVIAVSAVGPDDRVTEYSSYGPGVEIAAPGGDTNKEGGGILQDTIDGTETHAYKEFQGTSMASPHVAGGLAVLLGMGLAPRAAVHALYSSAVDLGEPGFDEKYGHGRMSLERAIAGVAWRRGALQTAVGAAVALALLLLVGLGGRAVLVTPVMAALTAGGLFFVPLLDVRPGIATHLLALDLLRWPGALLGAGFTHNAIWGSALLVVVITFLGGMLRRVAAAVAGFSAGIGVALVCGGAHQTLEAFHSPTGNTLWLIANGLLCLVAAAVPLAGLKKGRAR